MGSRLAEINKVGSILISLSINNLQLQSLTVYAIYKQEWSDKLQKGMNLRDFGLFLVFVTTDIGGQKA